MTIITTPDAPAAIGPYSQAVRHGDFIFCSGQLALDPQTMELVGETTAEQTTQIFKNMAAVLAAAGSSLAGVTKTTVFLKDMNDFAEMNRVYADVFGDHKPARAAVEVARLPKDARVEIECVAVADR